MREVHKGYVDIASRIFYVYVYVELDENNPDEYNEGEIVVNTGEIVAKALQKQEHNIFTSDIFGIFAEDVKKLFYIRADDLYEGTIDEMLESMSKHGKGKWDEYYKELYSSVTTTEYKGKNYKCYIETFITR